MLKRLTRWPFTSKSSDTMLPDMSRATTMSTPLAVTLVSLWVKRGWESAKIRSARESQRSDASTRPERVRLTLRMPRTNCTDE